MKKILKYLFVLIGGIICFFVITFLGLGFILPSDKPTLPTATDRYVNVYGSKIRYRDNDGSGPVIILMHGFGSGLELWEPLAKHLQCSRIITLDIIGFGGSDRPVIDYDLETHRRYILKFMDALKIDRAVLIGSSMGGSIAAWTGSHSNDRVMALVLFAPSGYPGSMWHRWPKRLFYRPGILNKLGRVLVKKEIFAKLFPNSLARQALDITSCYDDSFAVALLKIRQPTLLVWSRGDKRVPLIYSRFYKESIQHARFIERPLQAGHAVATFDPQDTSENICDLVIKATTG